MTDDTSASTEPAGDTRRDPRAMLALVTLAVDLPVPTRIGFNGVILAMSFDHISEGQAWSTHLGGKTDTYIHHDRRYLNEGLIDWHGWSVQLTTSEPVTPDAGLDEQTAAQLADIAGGDPS